MRQDALGPPDSLLLWDAAVDGRPRRDGGDEAAPLIDGFGLDQSTLPSVNGWLISGREGPEIKRHRWHAASHSWQEVLPAPPSSLDLRWAEVQPSVSGGVVALQGIGLTNERLEIWQLDGGIWYEVPHLRQEAADTALEQIRDYALGREALSGDLLLVVSAKDKAPHYATYSGGQWSAVQRLPSGVSAGNYVRWVKLVSRPASDELMLLYSDSSQDLYAVRWDGSAWHEGSYKELTNDLNKNDITGDVSNRSFDGAYEGSSEQFLAVWGRETKLGIQHATWDGSAWTKSGDNEFYPGHTYFVDLAADPRPGSSLIAGVFVDLGGGYERVAAGVWNGDAWLGLQEYDGQIYDYNDEGRGDAVSAVGWVGDKAICVYGDEGGTPKWLSWQQSQGDWTLHQALMVSSMGRLESVSMASQLQPDAGVVVLLSDSNDQLFGIFYDGGNWLRLSQPPITTPLTSVDTVPFAFVLVP